MRVAAVDALGQIGSADAVPVLVAVAGADDRECAAAALQALGRISHPDAGPPLQAALRGEEPHRRAAAAEALSRRREPSAVDLLEWAAAADADPLVVDAAIEALTVLAADRSVGRSAIKALVELAADPARQEQVVGALARVPPDSSDAIAHGLSDARPAVRITVLRAFGRMRRPEASGWLQTALADAEPEVRVAAITELRHLGSRGLEGRMASLARGDADAGVRRAALVFLTTTAGTPDVAPADGTL